MDFAKLQQWFSTNKRPFPWRKGPSPYAVLVSEVMLQQTQASRVVPYFLRWMSLFPTIEQLAHAPEDQIIKIWEGLGYYSRARSLKKAAQTIVKIHKGLIPSDRTTLLSIPGIGPYTSGAIVSFAFHKKCAVVDANISRVLCRILDSSFSHKELEVLLEQHLPTNRPWECVEALIELGALICTRRPCCTQCPWQALCLANQRKTQQLYPRKKDNRRTKLYRDVLLCTCDHSILVIHRTGKQLMSGLYEFPFFDSFPGGRTEKDILSLLDATIHKIEMLPIQTHAFTRFHATLYPTVFQVPRSFAIDGAIWVEIKKIKILPFSSGHKKIAHSLLRSTSFTYL